MVMRIQKLGMPLRDKISVLEIDVFKKDCQSVNNCVVNKIQTDLSGQIQDKILKKAAIYSKDLKELRQKSRPKKSWGGKDK